MHPLESRRLLSATFDSGLLTLTGTQRADHIELVAGENDGEVAVFGVEGVDDGTVFDSVDAIRILGDQGNDRIEIGQGIRATDSSFIGMDIDAGEGNNKVFGGDGDDIIVVGSGKNEAHGGAGDDTITSGSGKNKLYGDDGNDTLTAGSGNNRAEGGLGDDVITVANGNNRVEGGEGDDTITLGNGNNKVEGDDGDDTIIAGHGKNKLNGDGGNDTITSGDGKDKIDGGDGDDVIDGGNGNNKVKGRAGNDTITTGDGKDKIDGGDGVDIVDSGEGDDNIDNEEKMSASIGFWQNKHGQELIELLNDGPESTDLSTWLATNFVNAYGASAGENDLTGMTNVEVAEFYESVFKQKNRDTRDRISGPSKMDAKAMAVALSMYVTNQSLAGDIATEYGFLVTPDGLGAETVNVGNNGAAFGVDDDTDMTVMDAMLAADSLAFEGIFYDMDTDGDATDDEERGLRTSAHNVFSSILDDGEGEDEDEDEDEA